jgi:site-specific recombinase XerD
MSGFLNQLAAPEKPVNAKLLPRAAGETRPGKRCAPGEEGLLLKRDRALLELLYAAGLRVSELTGLNLVDMDRHEKMLRVRGKGDKERIVPYGGKAQEALEAYWPVRRYANNFCCNQDLAGGVVAPRTAKRSSLIMQAAASLSALLAVSSKNMYVSPT